jgi:hypothetical protein
LCEVFGIVRVTRKVERERVDAPLKPLRQPRESFRIARLSAFN